MSAAIRSRSPLRTPLIAATLLLFILVLLLFAVNSVYARRGPRGGERLTIASVESLGLVTFETGYTFAGTEVGGLSGIAYDRQRDVYYLIADDGADPRFYTVAIDLGADGGLNEEDITFLDVTSLTDQQGMPFEPGTVDAESIVMARPGQLIISTEGEVDSGIDPFINRFNPQGKQTRPLTIPEKFLIGGDNQVRDNLGFESLAVTPDMRHLFVATENALLNDGPIATLTEPSPSRFLQYYFFAWRPGPEYVYIVSPIPAAPDPPDAFADNGVSDIEALDNHGTFLAMERSFAVGVGNTVRLFETSTQGATNVARYEVLPDPSQYEPMDKRLVADFETDLGLDPDNLEAIRFGPTLPDGRRLLIVVSDNNFNPTQTTQFIALAVELVPAQ